MAESLVQIRIVLLYTHAILMIATRLVRERIGFLSIVRAASNVPGYGLPIASKYLRCDALDDIYPAIRVGSNTAGREGSSIVRSADSVFRHGDTL